MAEVVCAWLEAAAVVFIVVISTSGGTATVYDNGAAAPPPPPAAPPGVDALTGGDASPRMVKFAGDAVLVCEMAVLAVQVGTCSRCRTGPCG